MGIREIALLVGAFGLLLYIASFIKEKFIQEKNEPEKSDEEYAKESVEQLVVKPEDKLGEKKHDQQN